MKKVPRFWLGQLGERCAVSETGGSGGGADWGGMKPAINSRLGMLSLEGLWEMFTGQLATWVRSWKGNYESWQVVDGRDG